MDEDLPLFQDEASSDPMPIPPAPALADWQVKQLREALDGCGVSDMAERQRLIESLVGRPVASLRNLQSSEVRSLLEQLHARASSAGAASQGSSWDNRDEDTWIDRL